MGRFTVPNFSFDRHDRVGSPSNSQTSGVLLASDLSARKAIYAALSVIAATTLLTLYVADNKSNVSLQAAQQKSTISQKQLIELSRQDTAALPLSGQTNAATSTDIRSNVTLPNVDVTVNGQSIEIPQSGTVSQQVTTPSGSETNVTITQNNASDGSGSVSNSSTSTTNFEISGSSKSSVESETNIRVRERTR